MELKGIEHAHKLPGKLREALKGLGRGIKKLGTRFKQAKEGS